jgi:pimeloyl-ACP methyl ester carboxylesterase
MPVPPKTQYAKSGDVHVAYQVTGAGPLDLVFVPGFVSHLEYQWEHPWSAHFFDRLGSFSRLIRFDKRGTGLSDRVGGIPTLEERMDDVRAVMDAAGSERAALVGISEGGPMELLFAATYPERTSSLVLWASFARSVEADDYPFGAHADVAESTFEWVERAWGQGKVLRAIAFRDASRDESMTRLLARVERNCATPSSAAAALRFGAQTDVRHVLGAISAPTLVLHRTGDGLIPVECGRYLAEHIDGSKYVAPG